MAWTSERVLKQIELGEDSRVEFKEVRRPRATPRRLL